MEESLCELGEFCNVYNRSSLWQACHQHKVSPHSSLTSILLSRSSVALERVSTMNLIALSNVLPKVLEIYLYWNSLVSQASNIENVKILFFKNLNPSFEVGVNSVVNWTIDVLYDKKSQEDSSTKPRLTPSLENASSDGKYFVSLHPMVFSSPMVSHQVKQSSIAMPTNVQMAPDGPNRPRRSRFWVRDEHGIWNIIL